MKTVKEKEKWLVIGIFSYPLNVFFKRGTHTTGAGNNQDILTQWVYPTGQIVEQRFSASYEFVLDRLCV